MEQQNDQGGPKAPQPTDKALAELAHGMPIQPWGIGSRREDAFAFARAAMQLQSAEAAQRLRELSEALDAFDSGGFSEEKVNRINAARKAAREYVSGVAPAASSSPDMQAPQNVVAVTEGIWQAIIDWDTAKRALDKRRAAKELMNAEFIDRVNAAEERIDTLIASAMRAPEAAVGESSGAPVWDDMKVAFSIEDEERFITWAAKTRAFYSDGTAGFPKGWELVETNGAGARCVAVFRVEGWFRPKDAAAVGKLLIDACGHDADLVAKKDKSGPSL